MTDTDVVILGSSGRLGRALCAAYDGARIHRPTRADILAWSKSDGAKRYFAALPEKTHIHVALGVIDPKAPGDVLESVNVGIPRQVLDASLASGHRVFTYGTVMEGILSEGQRNPYIESKVRLADLVRSYADEGGTAAHFRLHTLYGGAPPPDFMFAGQMFNAIRSGTEFPMTNGRQYREYHHVSDEADAIVNARPTSAVVEVSHGNPIRLRDLATSVFDAFNATDLLKLGAIADPVSEFYTSAAPEPAATVCGAFRPARPGVIAWFEELGLQRAVAPQEARK